MWGWLKDKDLTYDSLEFDNEFAIRIFCLKFKFRPTVPECHVELASQCMDIDPDKRPAARYIYDESEDDVPFQ